MSSEESELMNRVSESFIMQNDEWETAKLDDVAEIILGQSPKGEYYNESGDGPPFLQGSKNFGNKYPTLERYCSQPKRVAEAGDVLISVRAPPGPVNIAPEKLCIGRGVTALRANEGPNDFLYYYLKFFEPRWDQLAGGTTFKSINKSDLQSLEIPYPPLEQRKQIAETLAKFDQKIEIDEEIGRDLDEFTRVLFKQKFGDERGDSVELSEICETSGGGTPSTDVDEYWGGEINWLTPKEVTSLNVPVVSKTERTLTEDGINNTSAKIMPTGSVLLTSRATVGDVVVNMSPMATNQGFICISPSEEIESYFVANLVRSKRGEIENLASGSTYPEISQRDFNSIRVFLPSKKARQEYQNTVSPIYEMMHKLSVEVELLKETRDTLIESIFQ